MDRGKLLKSINSQSQTNISTSTQCGNQSIQGFEVDAYVDLENSDGSNLDGVVSGIELEQAGSSVGTSVTAINFASGATLTSVSSGISTVTIAAGLNTTAATVSGIVTFLSLDDAQDHKLTISGISTISCTGGSEGDSHIVRIVNSGITTVGFSTFFLFPSGSTPSLPTADGAISLISFTVHRVGAAGTQLLAGASVNYS